MTMRTLLVLGLTLTLFGLGFGGGRTAAAQGDGLPADLLDKEWSLVSLQRAPGDTLDATGKKITLQFAADGTASGSDGCNRIIASYTTGAAGKLTITLGPTTLIACEPAVTDLATAYTKALGAVSSYSVPGPGRLALTASDGQVLSYTTGATTGGPATLPTTGGAEAPLAGGLLLALLLCCAGLGLRQVKAARR
jgi:heat shock protein HslJ